MVTAVSPLERLTQLRTAADARLREATAGYRLQISVGMATCGISAGAEAVWDALQEEIDRSGARDISLKRLGCIGQCHAEPLVEFSARGKA
ncbi:MAG TPA: (2Fe-2S) ferredoxin domain-containing protein, partial [Armatimonadota bacterium]